MTPRLPENPPHDPDASTIQLPAVPADPQPETPQSTGAASDATVILPAVTATDPAQTVVLPAITATDPAQTVILPAITPTESAQTAVPPAITPTGDAKPPRSRALTMTALLSGALVALCLGGVGIVGLIGGSASQEQAGKDAQVRWSTAVPEDDPSAEPTDVDQPAGPVPEPSSAPTATVEKKTITQTRSIPYETKKIEDPNLPKGTEKVQTQGVNGVRTLTYEVTITDGKQTGKRLVSDVVTRKPVTEVIVVGTKPPYRCNPNYSGCIPIAWDADCVGHGRGPVLVKEPVKVIGRDVYHLDRDGDGIGCNE